MPAYKNEMCLECGKRKRRFKDGGCEPCHNRIIAEGTIQQSNLLPPPRVAREKLWRDIAKKYNRMIRGGITSQPELAQRLGLPVEKLRSIVYHAKKQFGIKFISLTRRAPGAPLPAPTSKRRQFVNDHGGGRWGVAKCKCELCVNRRRATRREIHEEKKKRAEQMLQRLAELETWQGEKMT